VPRFLALLFAGVACLGGSFAAGSDALRVRSAAVAAPCVEAVGAAWEAREGRGVVVQSGSLRDGGDWDVLVGSSVEINRSLEGGDAVIDSDVDVARIPWVLRLAGGGQVRALSDVVRSGVEIVVPAGPAAYEARRVLAEAGTARVVETDDRARLRSAPVALVPVSLAGPGRQVEVDVRPISVIAALGIRARSTLDARAFVQFLGSEAGQDVFAACGAPAPDQ
jgi:ABC-type sulfate transport system substrate-binding protein